MGDVHVDSGRLFYAPQDNPNDNPHATAIPVGAEQHLGMGNNTGRLAARASSNQAL